MNDKRVRCVKVLIFILATMALYLPIMEGQTIEGGAYGKIVVRGINLIEFAPAAWLLPISPIMVLATRIFIGNERRRMQIRKACLAFSLASYLTSLPYAWRWLSMVMDEAKVRYIGSLVYPAMISCILSLERRRILSEP